MSKALRLTLANKAQVLFTLAVVVILAAVLVVVWLRLQALAEISPRQRASDFVDSWLDQQARQTQQLAQSRPTPQPMPPAKNTAKPKPEGTDQTKAKNQREDTDASKVKNKGNAKASSPAKTNAWQGSKPQVPASTEAPADQPNSPGGGATEVDPESEAGSGRSPTTSGVRKSLPTSDSTSEPASTSKSKAKSASNAASNSDSQANPKAKLNAKANAGSKPVARPKPAPANQPKPQAGPKSEPATTPPPNLTSKPKAGTEPSHAVEPLPATPSIEPTKPTRSTQSTKPSTSPRESTNSPSTTMPGRDGGHEPADTYQPPPRLAPEDSFQFTIIDAEHLDAAARERPFLARAIRQFRFRPDEAQRFGAVTDSDGQTYYRYVRPIRQSQWKTLTFSPSPPSARRAHDHTPPTKRQPAAKPPPSSKQPFTTKQPTPSKTPASPRQPSPTDQSSPADSPKSESRSQASNPSRSTTNPSSTKAAKAGPISHTPPSERSKSDTPSPSSSTAQQASSPANNQPATKPGPANPSTPTSQSSESKPADNPDPTGKTESAGKSQSLGKSESTQKSQPAGQANPAKKTRAQTSAESAKAKPQPKPESKITRPSEPAPSTNPAKAQSPAQLAQSDPIVKLALVQIRDPRVEARKTTNLVYLAGATLLGGVLALGLFWLITTGLFLAPLRLLGRQARRVQAGQTDVRTELDSRDEYQELAEMLNALVSRWQGSRDELTQVNKSMNLKLDKLAESNVALYEANKVKTDFLANVSHELRTPLHSIVGFAEVLEGTPGPPDDANQEKRQRYVKNILTSSKQLLELITDLLDLAKIEAGRMELHLGQVSISDTCEGLVTLIRPLAEPRRILVRQKIESRLPMVETDAGKLQQVLFNFLSNAVKFSSDGGLITLSAVSVPADQREGKPRIRLSVTDRGPGISAEDRNRIFDKFTQLDPSVTRAQGGTGLGLTICQELAQLLQGRIEVASDPGKGATFSLTIPSVIGPARAPLMPNLTPNQPQSAFATQPAGELPTTTHHER